MSPLPVAVVPSSPVVAESLRFEYVFVERFSAVFPDFRKVDLQADLPALFSVSVEDVTETVVVLTLVVARAGVHNCAADVHL